MANTQWPADLPSAALWGWSLIPSDNVVRSRTSNGKTLGRQKYTKIKKTYQVSTILDKDQLAAFQEFWESGISGGADVFDWTLPETGAAATFFPVATYGHVHLSGGISQAHRITMTLEVR